MTTYPLTLLAEDDDNDVFFMQVAWRKAQIPSPLTVVRNGQEAIEYLRRARLSPAHESYPRLLLLDLNMPILNGFDVLTRLKRESVAEGLVVVVLTSSTCPGDFEKAKALGAADYLVKSCNATELIQTVRGLQLRWLTSPEDDRPARLPDRDL